jgi:subtilisin family serine protease
VAILDTGVQYAHPEIQTAVDVGNIGKSRCQGFPNTLNPTADKNGHGTHVVSVLLRTSPDVLLYIARVADDDGTIVPDEDYKEVGEVKSFLVR